MVLAGGRGDAARRLQQEATVASTPIIESGSLAIELHEQVASGERVPEHLFRGIAEVLAGVYRDTMVFCMPGSSGAVRLAMEKLIAPELSHLVWEIWRQK